MKRHEALAPLSRDHHGTLILAQLLKRTAPVYKGLPVDPEKKAEYARLLFEKDIREHFELEERMLDCLRQPHPEIQELGSQIRQEHRQLAAQFQSLENNDGLIERMDRLGNALEAHIRKEERVLFPLLQEYCSEEELQVINELLH